MPKTRENLSINTEKTRVILIGNSEFEDENLLSLPSVENNICDLKDLFVCPNIIGIPEQNITAIINNPSERHSLDLIISTLRYASDTLIFYYAGHGVQGGRSKRLYLATQMTNIATLERTGGLFSFENIWYTISDRSLTGVKNIIFILDCCYSGRALCISFGNRNVSILTATDELTKAEAPVNGTYTAFTGELISLLRNGIDNNQKILTLADIYHYLETYLANKNLPKPSYASFGNIYQLAIANNLSIQRIGISPTEKLLALHTELKELIEQKMTILNKQLEIHPQEKNIMKLLDETRQEHHQVETILKSQQYYHRS